MFKDKQEEEFYRDAQAAVAINEQLLKAVKHVVKWGEFMSQDEVIKAKAAIAAAEASKGGL